MLRNFSPLESKTTCSPTDQNIAVDSDVTTVNGSSDRAENLKELLKNPFDFGNVIEETISLKENITNVVAAGSFTLQIESCNSGESFIKVRIAEKLWDKFSFNINSDELTIELRTETFDSEEMTSRYMDEYCREYPVVTVCVPDLRLIAISDVVSLRFPFMYFVKGESLLISNIGDGDVQANLISAPKGSVNIVGWGTNETTIKQIIAQNVRIEASCRAHLVCNILHAKHARIMADNCHCCHVGGMAEEVEFEVEDDCTLDATYLYASKGHAVVRDKGVLKCNVDELSHKISGGMILKTEIIK